MSDIVRTAISQLIEKGKKPAYPLLLKEKILALACLLKREPEHVEKACVEGIVDLIQNKAHLPLIFMETQLHLSYQKSEASPDTAFN